MRRGNEPYIPPGCPTVDRGKDGLTIGDSTDFFFSVIGIGGHEPLFAAMFINGETSTDLGDGATGRLAVVRDSSLFARASAIAGYAHLEAEARAELCNNIAQCTGVIVGSDGRPQCSALGADALRQVIDLIQPE